jgi:mRNA-degrading endonuclease toxin of MazEF toxin-antitoxin module
MEVLSMGLDNYKRYDVYLAKLPKRKGSVQQGVRPVVIWRKTGYDYLMNEGRIVLSCFCLTTETKPSLPVHFLLKASESCLKEDSTFLAEQPVPLHEDNLIKKWGSITNKEYRYMIYRAISIQNSDEGRPYGIFKYAYKFLLEVQESSEGLEAVEFLIKKEGLNVTLKNELKSHIDSAKNKVIDICRKHNVIAGNYIKDLSDGNIDFSLLNL